MAGKDIDDAEKRHDQLTTAPKSTEEDAEARIDVIEPHDGAPRRIEIRDDAEVRPGGDPSLGSAAGD
ncbi:multidrug transporter [Herbiconiux sp. UC225_62]|uniref:multidrug transporter n=1 Tax=Herbiconiux sp. UC225_62 TaxID=3350168 RepID=UPI0036D3D2DE